MFIRRLRNWLSRYRAQWLVTFAALAGLAWGLYVLYSRSWPLGIGYAIAGVMYWLLVSWRLPPVTRLLLLVFLLPFSWLWSAMLTLAAAEAWTALQPNVNALELIRERPSSSRKDGP